MELRRLRYFLAVANEGHFGRAARRLKMAQPPLSRQIKALEVELGVTLLRRTRRGVELTGAGKTFVREAKGALAQVERASHEARRAGAGQTGRLSLAVSPAAELCLIPRVVPAFLRRFPDAQLDIHAIPDSQQSLALQSGIVQVGLLVPPVSHRGEFTLEPLFREPLTIALPAKHPLARRRRLSPADLEALPLVLFRRDVAPHFYDVVAEVFARSRRPLEASHDTDNMHTCVALVAAGVGYTVIPAAAKAICAQGVIYCPLTPPVPQIELAALYSTGDGAEIVCSFLSTLREVARRMPRLARR